MKKFTRIALSLSAFFAVVGIVSIICAITMGMTWNGLREMIRNGELVIKMDDSEEYTRIIDNENYMQTIEDGCSKLDIELEAGTLNLYYDDVDKIRVKHKGFRNFHALIKGDTLFIESEEGIISNGSNAVVTIIIPKETMFKEVELNIGAGQADVDELCAEKVSVEVGAGQVKLSYLDTKKFEAETGAGQIKANLVESEDAYSYDAECGIGEIKIGNNSISGLGGEKNVTNPGAERHLDIECGVGQIEISFQK